MKKLIEDLKERIEIGLQYDTISGGTANDLLELVTKMQVKNNGVSAVVSNSLIDLDGKTIPVTFHVSKFMPKIDID